MAPGVEAWIAGAGLFRRRGGYTPVGLSRRTWRGRGLSGKVFSSADHHAGGRSAWHILWLADTLWQARLVGLIDASVSVLAVVASCGAAVHGTVVLRDESIERVRQGEDDMEVGHGQQVFFLPVKPLVGAGALAARTMPVAATRWGLLAGLGRSRI